MSTMRLFVEVVASQGQERLTMKLEFCQFLFVLDQHVFQKELAQQTQHMQ
jgi:hypothetical protein